MTSGALFAAHFTSCGNKTHSLKAVPLDSLIAKSGRVDVMLINDILAMFRGQLLDMFIE